MGFFSNAIPQRKRAEVTADLGAKLLAASNKWFATFQQETAGNKFPLKQTTLTVLARKYVNMIQLSAVSATLQENGYVKNIQDATFLMELIYVIMTQNPPSTLHGDIESVLFMFTDDAQASLASWAQAMAREISSNPTDQTLIKVLTAYGAGLATNAKIYTCLACGDPKTAEKIRTFIYDSNRSGGR
ncbi:MAG: hypothetical protein ACRED7_12340 [Stellaceae bacterium]